MKSVPIRSYSSSYFPAFGLNADQNNFEYGRLLRSDIFLNDLLTILYSDYLLKYKKTLRITFWIRQRCSLFDNWNPCTSGIFNKVLFWLRKEATQPRLNFTKKNPFFQFKKNILCVALPLFWKLESWTTMNNWHLFTNRQNMRHFLKIIPVTFPTHKLRQDRQNMFFFQITANSPYP